MKKLLVLIPLIVGRAFAGSFVLNNNTEHTCTIKIHPEYKSKRTGDDVYVEDEGLVVRLRAGESKAVHVKPVTNTIVSKFQLLISCGKYLSGIPEIADLNSVFSIEEESPEQFSFSRD